MDCKKDGGFLKKRAQKLFEDSLRHPCAVLDERTLRAMRGLLSLSEQANADFSTAVVTGTTLIVVCDYPERIKEAILVDTRNPIKVFRWRLALKDKKNPAKA